MEENNNNFLQSDVWRKFQEAVGYRTFFVSVPHPSPLPKGEGDFVFSASIIEHQLPVVGKYLYIPRGPLVGISNFKFQISNEIQSSNDKIKKGMQCLMDLARKNNAGWIRIEPENEETLEIIKKNVDYKIAKAPHDMQPKEILAMDIAKTEEELLSEMKAKTRYNIKLAEKKGVGVTSSWNKKYINEFVRLIKLTEKRKSIKFHSANYYQKMLEVIPSDILRLYVAEYNNKVIAANLVIFYGNTAIYLHGATDDEYRNVMAPYLLQWQAIKDAKKAGFLQYDFGGVKRISPLSSTPSPGGRGWLEKPSEGNWSGITKFKLGFAPNTDPIIFPGSYDIIIDRKKYYLYKIIQKTRCFLK